MRVACLACLLISFAVKSLTAQSAPGQQEIRALSMRWAEYYSVIYRAPLDLVMAIIDEESAWNPYAVSEKGAVGLMQLMPQTGLRFGVRNRFRLDENIRGGVAYLALLNREFDGDFRLVTAAFYVGEDPIRRRKLDYSCADVQGYVRRVAERYRARRRRAANLQLVNGPGDEK